MANATGHPIARLRSTLGVIRRRIDQYNPAHRARRNVAHHYDLNGRLYSLFLDRDRQYSCAYFPRGDETLEEAQIAKKRHIAAKLCLDRPGLSVLDIGSGWGGLALTLARDHGAQVTGHHAVHRAARRGACARRSRGAGTIASRSNCSTIACWTAASTASSRSACSSMSASCTIANSSTPWRAA